MASTSLFAEAVEKWLPPGDKNAPPAARPATAELLVEPQRICWLLFCGAALVVYVGGLAEIARAMLGTEELYQLHLLGLTEKLSLDEENSLPTWFQAGSLLLCAGLLSVIAWFKAQTQAGFARHWAVLALCFLLLSLDEAAGLHELGGELLRQFFATDGWPPFAWKLPGLAFVLLGVIYARFLLALPGRFLLLFMVAAAFYLGGAVGLEMAGDYVQGQYGLRSLPYALTTTAEEALEICGVQLFLYALLAYLGGQMKDLYLTFARNV